MTVPELVSGFAGAPGPRAVVVTVNSSDLSAAIEIFHVC